MGILIFGTFVALVNLFFTVVLDFQSYTGRCSAILCEVVLILQSITDVHIVPLQIVVSLRCCWQARTRLESCIAFGVLQLESTCSWHPCWDVEGNAQDNKPFCLPCVRVCLGARQGSWSCCVRYLSRREARGVGFLWGPTPGAQAAFQPLISAESELFADLLSLSGQR